MKELCGSMIGRRDLFRAVIGSASAAAAITATVEAAAAAPRGSGDKRKARYRADSAEVKDFYRVNRYPAK